MKNIDRVSGEMMNRVNSRKELQIADDEMVRLKADNMRKDKEIRELDGQLTEKNQSLMELTKTNKQLETKEADLRDQLDSTKREMERLTQKLNDEMVRGRQTQDDLTKVENSLRVSTRNHKEQLMRVEAELDSVKNLLKEMESREQLMSK